MKNLISVAFAGLLAGGASADWQLVWSDEFNGTELDSSKWGYELGFVRNKEYQYYTNKTENVRVEHGCLVLQGHRVQWKNPDFVPGQTNDWTRARADIAITSGSVNTRERFSFTHGRIECRAKVPARKGSWPAIWTLGADIEEVGWPRCGEIDVLEFYGQTPDRVTCNVHGFSETTGRYASPGGCELRDRTPTDGFHVYALEWNEREAVCFYDGVRYGAFPLGEYGGAFSRPHYILLNLALGAEWMMPESEVEVDDGTCFEVDWIRVYRKAAAASGREAPAGGVSDYAALREELRAFYPAAYCRGACQAPEQAASCKAIGDDLDAWAAAHLGFDALDVRRESYLAMRRHFVPFLFANSPFYFEAGVNGGWSGARPARHVNRICGRFYREQGLIPQAAWDLLSARSRENLTLCCGPFVDDMHHVPPMRTIIRKGFRGVRDAVAAALANCPKDDPLGRKELETALVGLDTVHAIQLKFAEEAERCLKTVGAGEERTRLLRIAASARRCPWEPPQTFFEALNTLWFVREILGYVDGVNIFALGRPDAWFIDLYRRDLADGRLTEAEARDLVARFLIIADCHEADSAPVDSYDDQEAEIPLTLGGCDEKGAFVYNELTRMFLDAHLACGCVYPKLHVRVDANSPQAYLDHIGRQLMAGHAVFTVFNDRRLVRQFLDEGFAPEDARNYIGCGCWNGYIDSCQDVDGANYVSLVKILALTIHRDPEVERRCGLVLDPIDGARSFEELRDTVYRNYMRFFRSLMSEYTRYGRTSAKVFPHPVYTMCLEGGVESRRDTTDGGITGRQRPKEITLGFVGNVVDSLCAIDQVCFRDRVCTVREFLDAVRANWKGEKNQRLRMLAMNAPYWGDNSDRSTSLMAWFMKRTHEDVDGFATDQGGAYRLAIFTYREFMYWGAKTKATPDGRYDGDRLAQGFSPSEFRCKEGATAVMNAIGRLPNECLYQCNANLTFDASAMTPELMGAILRVFAEKGSHLMQPNCNSVEQLLDAQRHPERHRDLIVRVCGFSARFVSLSKRWQDEVIARHRLK